MSDTSVESLAAPLGRAVNITLWVLQVLLAAFFVFVGFIKLVGFQQEVEAFAVIGLGQWFRYLTGALEVAGAIGLLIPRLSGLAALGLAGVMVGAVITHLTVLPPAAFALFPAFLCVVFGLIAWARWPQSKALAGSRPH
ncbi:MAG TPA: DoxX family protein [Pseudonocardiaceae bacterium]|nr:DoxX family protein [Pseudonocardiaceae bacterium]